MSARITVIGTGYLGATHAACMAELGHEVIGMDSDTDKVAALAQGHAPFFEPGLDDLLAKGIESGRLRFTTSYQEAADFGDVHFALSTQATSILTLRFFGHFSLHDPRARRGVPRARA